MGRNAVVALEVEAVYFCSPGVVLCKHHCHFAGPVVSVYVPFFVSSGSWTSSSACGVNLASVFHWLHPSVVAVSGCLTI